MTPNATARTTVTDDRALLWAPCPMCWGQRRIWTREQAANGEGAVLVATTCSPCLGVGEVVAA